MLEKNKTVMTKNRTVIQLSTDPLDSMIKGGEQRSGSFNSFLNECFDLKSYVLPLYYIPDSGGYRWIYKLFPEINSLSPEMKAFYGKYLRVFYKYRALINEIREVLPQADMIIFEHPWMYPLFQRQIKPCQIVVYSSHNVEWKMIYNLCRCDRAREKTEKHLKVIEHDLVARADLVIACSAEDSWCFKGVMARKVLVIPNGSKDRSYSFRNSLLIASSDHQPNVDSLINFFESLDLSVNVNFVLVGSIADALPKVIVSKFADKILSIGECSDDALNFFYAHCDSVLLFVDSGGGSNIKTAEALSLDKKIFATDFSLRGFEYSDVKINVCPCVTSLAKRVYEHYGDGHGTSLPIKRQYLWQTQRDIYIDTLQSLLDID